MQTDKLTQKSLFKRLTAGLLEGQTDYYITKYTVQKVKSFVKWYVEIFQKDKDIVKRVTLTHNTEQNDTCLNVWTTKIYHTYPSTKWFSNVPHHCCYDADRILIQRIYNLCKFGWNVGL